MKTQKPSWITTNLRDSQTAASVRKALVGLGLNTICVEGRCPNIGTCFNAGTATFLAMGSICTRHCLYCNVQSGFPQPLDDKEPARIAEAVKRLGLRYAVITSVTRDDLPDGGAAFFRSVVDKVKEINPHTTVEALVPDFKGIEENWERFVTHNLDVFAHNVEVAGRLFGQLRPQGNLDKSLHMLAFFKNRGFVTKSGFMVGVGESMDEIKAMLSMLASVGVDIVTVGQYLQPSKHHWEVHKYYTPEEFELIREMGVEAGIPVVVAGPMVRSSFLADQAYKDVEPQSH